MLGLPSLAAVLSPRFAGLMLSLSSFGWPLISAGVLKIAYDLVLLQRFRAILPPEELAAVWVPRPDVGANAGKRLSRIGSPIER